MFCFSCDEILSLDFLRLDLKVFIPLKITCTLVYQIFFTEARKIGNRDKDIFLHAQASVWIHDGTCWLLFIFFDHRLWVDVCKKNSLEVVHFFSKDFRSGTNICSSVN